MTTREIAEAVGKKERAVHNWVLKVSAINAEVSAKIAQARASSIAADYDLDETIAIIEQGMGRNAAEVYRQNAGGQNVRNYGQNDRNQIDYLKIAEIIAATVGTVMDRALSRLALPGPAQLQLPAPLTHMSLTGYIRSKGERAPDIETLKRIGAALSAQCREDGLVITKIPDDRWGHVNGYPLSVLEDYYRI